MSLFKEIDKAIREKDMVETAIKEVCAKHTEEEEESVASACKKYMNPSRANDFAKVIAQLMDNGASYGDAKAQAFDETEMPPSNSPCCKFIRSAVAKYRKKSVSESEVINEARRKVGEYENADTGRKAVLYKDPEWEEFQVEFFQDGKHQKKATYHTDDKQDAIDTGKGFINKKF